MGRPRKPSALKLLHGDYDKNPQRRNEAEPEVTPQSPICPAWITGKAREEWKRVTEELGSLKILGLVDRSGLEQYCTIYALWRQALLDLKNTGSTYQTEHGVCEHPNAKAVRNYADQIHKILSQFGLTPAARTRLNVEKDTAPARMRRQRG